MAAATGGVVSADAIDLGTGLKILVSADRSQVSEGLRTACPGGHGSTSALTALSSEDPEQKALAASRVARGIPGRFCGIPLGGIHRSDSRTGRDDTESRASFGLPSGLRGDTDEQCAQEREQWQGPLPAILSELTSNTLSGADFCPSLLSAVLSGEVLGGNAFDNP